MFTVFKKISDVKVYVMVPALLFTLILMGSTALADSRDNELIVIDLIGEGPGALSFGEVSILDNPTGPDLLRFLPAFLEIEIRVIHTSLHHGTQGCI